MRLTDISASRATFREKRERNASRSWPASGLEMLGHCPVCESTERVLIHEAAVDHLFSAPGQWRMYQCDACETAYLDPRPSADSIHLAYSDYYTHDSRSESGDLLRAPGTWTRIFKRRVLDAYLNARYDRRSGPVENAAAMLMFMRPKIRRWVDVQLRHLPPSLGVKHLLDVGCGGGGFLLQARRVGWATSGLEFDTAAAARCIELGLDVRIGTLESCFGREPRFDAITISHVIEHVHTPLAMLRAARALLRPGGYFWIETPNVNAYGHSYYGEGWEGIHAPFHLQLFSIGALTTMLLQAGFSAVKVAPWRPRLASVIAQSLTPPSCPGGARELSRIRLATRELLAKIRPTMREHITLCATTQP